jgi:carbon-monoxide dehydrogenase large subunit
MTQVRGAMKSVIGVPLPRLDGYEKVTGQARFTADLRPARVLHARVVRSTQAHARLLRLDCSAARACPGVRAVLCVENLPRDSHTGEPRRYGSALSDQTPLAWERVRYAGEPLAVIVAVDADTAERACELVTIEYEPLPILLHPRHSAQPGAALIHPALEGYQHVDMIRPRPASNIAHTYRLRYGDVERGRASAALVVENEYWLPWIAHAQLEPHAALAQYDGRRLTLWSSTQSPFYVRETVAGLLGMDSTDVRVQTGYIGGGFGGKSDVTIEPLLAIVAHHLPGLPIELVLTREEMFQGTANGRGCWGWMRTAVDEQGMLLSQEADLYFGSGAYADYSVWISQGGGHNSGGPYFIPNLDLQSHAVYTNTPPTGAYRGYGHPEIHWMVERQMDIIARRIGMDPYELRLKNLLRPGQVNAIGQVMKTSNGRADLCLKAVRDALGSPQPPTLPNRRRASGLACFMKSPVMKTNAQSGALLKFNEDGSATLHTGSIEMGQGVATILTQIAAETLRIPVERIRYTATVDTDYSPLEWQTVASHSTWAVGSAVRMAAEDALNQLVQAAARIFSVSPREIEYSEGKLWPRGRDQETISYARIGAGYTLPNGSALNPPVAGQGLFVPKALTFPDPSTGQGNMAASWTFGCQGVDLEVDLDTGRIYVLRMVSAQDAGRIINPETARGQVEGAMVMALGAALMEDICFAPDGSIRNPGLVDYRIPTSMDIPKMEVIFIETEDENGPYGARGLGEHGIVAIPPAIANALAQAIGIEFYELPLTPEKITHAWDHTSSGIAVNSHYRGDHL